MKEVGLAESGVDHCGQDYDMYQAHRVRRRGPRDCCARAGHLGADKSWGRGAVAVRAEIPPVQRAVVAAAGGAPAALPPAGGARTGERTLTARDRRRGVRGGGVAWLSL